LLTIINDILDFSKIEANHLILEEHAFNFRDVLESTLDVVSVSAHKKNLELITSISADVPILVKGDDTRLRQIIVNLISNAVKFTKAGEIVLSAAVAPIDSAGHHDVDHEEDTLKLHIAISDTGIGIPEDKIETLFKPFSQADASTTRKYGGTGLGLTISSRLINLMGGTIWVESQVGAGSTFHFTIQVKVNKQFPEIQNDVFTEVDEKRAIIVFPNNTLRLIVKAQLERLGIQVRDFESWPAAKTWVDKNGLDEILILDMAGDVYAHRTVRKMKIASPSCKIFLAGSYEDRHENHYITGYLVKPLKEYALQKTLTQAFNQDPVMISTNKALAK
ncbi:MAG: ATP-binding protein, partial [Rhodothermales bacterium]